MAPLTGWLRGGAVPGGVKRIAPLAARPWVTASSPDGAIQVFFGDPAVPDFTLPPPGQAEGVEAAPLAAGLPPMVAPRHYPGAGFAGFHGPRAPALAGCAGAMETGTRALPELARATGPRHESAGVRSPAREAALPLSG